MAAKMKAGKSIFDPKLRDGDIMRETYFLGYITQQSKLENQKNIKKAKYYYNKLKCPGCDRVFHSEFGLQSHARQLHDLILPSSSGSSNDKKVSSEKSSQVKSNQVIRRKATKKKKVVTSSSEDFDDEEIEEVIEVRH